MQKDNEDPQVLKSALNGDINAFEKLFSVFHSQLKSYLYRLIADRSEAEDLAHDTFVKGFDKISSFRGDSSFKTWMFQIATHLTYDRLRKRKRWLPDAQDQSKALARSDVDIQQQFHNVHASSTAGNYEIIEHIDFCFTCISKTLSIKDQVALILKDVYDFSVKDISLILNLTEGVIKHLLTHARQTMIQIFEGRCALVSKEGVCHQCSELNGLFNPKQNQQEELLKLELVRASGKHNLDELYALRTTLVKSIDPLQSTGTDLQDLIMKCTRKAIGEISDVNR